MAGEEARGSYEEVLRELQEDATSIRYPRLDRARRVLKSWAPLLLVGTAICGGAYALGRRSALGGLALHRPQHSNSSAYVGLQGILVPGFGDFGDDDEAFRVAGRPIVKRRFDISRCLANLLSSTFQLSDVGVTAVAANQDCPLAATGEVASSQVPLASAKSALLDIERLVKEAQGSIANDTSKLPALMQLRKQMLARASLGSLTEVEEKVDEAQEALEKVTTPDPEIDLYSVKRLAEMRCARDALIISRSTAAASAKLSVAAGSCPDDPNKPPGTTCAAQVSAAIAALSLVGAEIDRMVIRCRPGFFDLTLCAARLEGLSWQIAAASKFLSGATRVCGPVGSKAVKTSSYSSRDWGWCIGEIFSTMGYVGTTSMWIYNGAHYDCERMHQLIELMGNRTLTPLEMETMKVFRARCVADYASSVRTLFLGFTKGIRSAAHCGDLSETCPRDILRSASAFAGIAEACARIYGVCSLVPEYRGQEPANVTAIREPLCTQETASMVKMLGLATSFLTDATGSCVDTNFARTRCGASALRALAALGAFVEIYANMHLNCDLRKFWFLCGRDMRFSGETLRVFTLAVATAALNCGLDPLTKAWKSTKPVAMPRFFTFP